MYVYTGVDLWKFSFKFQLFRTLNLIGTTHQRIPAELSFTLLFAVFANYVGQKKKWLII